MIYEKRFYYTIVGWRLRYCHIPGCTCASQRWLYSESVGRTGSWRQSPAVLFQGHHPESWWAVRDALSWTFIYLQTDTTSRSITRGWRREREGSNCYIQWTLTLTKQRINYVLFTIKSSKKNMLNKREFRPS